MSAFCLMGTRFVLGGGGNGHIGKLDHDDGVSTVNMPEVFCVVQYGRGSMLDFMLYTFTLRKIELLSH